MPSDEGLKKGNLKFKDNMSYVAVKRVLLVSKVSSFLKPQYLDFCRSSFARRRNLEQKWSLGNCSLMALERSHRRDLTGLLSICEGFLTPLSFAIFLIYFWIMPTFCHFK